MIPSRTFVLGTEVDRVTATDAVNAVMRLARNGGRHLVVTPNVDHVIRLRRDAAFRAAYARAALILADGMPLVWASRLGAAPLPERVTGADLLEPVLAAAERDGASVFFLGPMRATLDLALARIATRYPRLRVAGAHAPPPGFEHDANADAESARAVRDARPDIVVVSLGAPKQELWVARHRDAVDFGVALCLGASVEFLAGVRPRCPPALARAGLEWLWRVSHEPRRLWRRYAQCLLLAPVLVWEQLRHARRFRART